METLFDRLQTPHRVLKTRWVLEQRDRDGDWYDPKTVTGECHPIEFRFRQDRLVQVGDKDPTWGPTGLRKRADLHSQRRATPHEEEEE